MLPVLALVLLADTAQARWGAIEPDAASRPDLGWLTRFDTRPNVIAVDDINHAIEQCDKKAGYDNYCVIEIRATKPVSPFTINRSKTKVIASAHSKPVMAVAGRATISIGSDTEQVLIENVELAGVKSGFRPVYGIQISGSRIRDIVLRKNRIHHYNSDSSAHGIIVLGSGATDADRIGRITISQNHLHDMKTGASESIAINGNVTNWVIDNNRIERVNNIAIDAIGGEGTAAPVRINGKVFPNPVDAARSGWIENNTVTAMSTLSNPAYGRVRSWAGAIYVDGGRSITITGNSVQGAPWAYDIGAENCVIAENITLRNNTATDSHFGDLRLGGYSETGYLADPTINCDPHNTEDANEGHGYVRRLTIAENNFQSLNTTQPPLLIEYRTTESVIAESGLEPEPGIGNGKAVGDGNAYRTTE